VHKPPDVTLLDENAKNIKSAETLLDASKKFSLEVIGEKT